MDMVCGEKEVSPHEILALWIPEYSSHAHGGRAGCFNPSGGETTADLLNGLAY